MAKTKEQKQEVITKLQNVMKAAASTIFVHFNKVSVAEESAMRRDLRQGGLGYIVAKKTLIRRALEALGHSTSDLQMDGEIAVAYGGGDDVTIVARTLHEFGKKLTNRLTIVGGIFEGKLVGAAQMQEVAAIPPLQTLRALFAQLINSPRQRLAVVLNQVAETK